MPVDVTDSTLLIINVTQLITYNLVSTYIVSEAFVLS